jgi:hypothetical protein
MLLELSHFQDHSCSNIIDKPTTLEFTANEFAQPAKSASNIPKRAEEAEEEELNIPPEKFVYSLDPLYILQLRDITGEVY